MQIVSAGVHNSLVFTFKGYVSFFVYGKSVYIGSESYSSALFLASDNCNRTCFKRRIILNPPLFKVGDYELCCIEFMSADLGKTVKLSADSDRLLKDSLTQADYFFISHLLHIISYEILVGFSLNCNLILTAAKHYHGRTGNSVIV